MCGLADSAHKVLNTDTKSSLAPCRPAGKSYTQHRLLLGTHTSGQDQDYLQIAQVQLPKRDIDLDDFKYDEDKGGELL